MKYTILIIICFFSSKLFSQLYIKDTFFIQTGSFISVKEKQITNIGISNFNTGKVVLNSDSAQFILGSNVIAVDSVVLDNNKNLSLQNGLIVNSHFNFTNGKITSDISNPNYYLGFLDNATYSGYSASMHVDGYVQKTGNDAFTFPVGNNKLIAPIAISAPTNVTDQFSAYYINGTNPYNTTSKDLTLNNVGKMEYWMLNRTIGTSSVTVNLSWDTRSGGVSNIADLRVAHWDGSKWNNVGNSSNSGSNSSGNVTSNLVSSFSPFTIASVSALNSLPVKLTTFEVTCNQEKIENLLKWTTSSEKNVDRFEIERSFDAKTWEYKGMVKAVGNSSSMLNYSFVDEYPLMGYNYYRLKMIDTDSKIEYSDIKYAILYSDKLNHITIYPIPTTEDQIIHIKSIVNQEYTVFLTNALGQKVSSVYDFSGYLNSISLEGLSKGIYYLQYESNGEKLVFKIIKN